MNKLFLLAFILFSGIASHANAQDAATPKTKKIKPVKFTKVNGLQWSQPLFGNYASCISVKNEKGKPIVEDFSDPRVTCQMAKVSDHVSLLANAIKDGKLTHVMGKVQSISNVYVEYLPETIGYFATEKSDAIDACKDLNQTKDDHWQLPSAPQMQELNTYLQTYQTVNLSSEEKKSIKKFRRDLENQYFNTSSTGIISILSQAALMMDFHDKDNSDESKKGKMYANKPEIMLSVICVNVPE